MSFKMKTFSCVAVCLLASQVALATTVALSENDSANGLLRSLPGGGNTAPLDPIFQALGAGDMVFSATDDASISRFTEANPGALWAMDVKWNSDTPGTVGDSYLSHAGYKFDLSSIPSNATIDKAELQFWGHNGNNGRGEDVRWGPITTHDWLEADVTANSPIGTAGITEWGTTSDKPFLIVGDIAPLDATSDVPVAQSGIGWGGWTHHAANGGLDWTWFMVNDVTSSLQSMVDGSSPNYGWGFAQANFVAQSSESNETFIDTLDPSNGANVRPILFVSYTAVPEPSTLLTLAIAVGLLGSKTRSRS